MIEQVDCSGKQEMIVTGTVKSFNYSKGYGFIRNDSDGTDVFVHLSAVREAGLPNLRKGQKLGFEIFDNQGKASAKNLHVNREVTGASEQKLVPVQNEIAQNARCEMKSEKAEQFAGKRTPIKRAALELAIAETVRERDPQCKELMGIIIERIAPTAAGGANWALKGIKYGKADRDRCSVLVATCVEERQREFELSD
jgi:cold shock CspA family protein